MTSKHTHKSFLKRVDRIGVRLPDDVKEMLFEFAKENNLLDAEYVKDIVIPFMRTKNGVEPLEIEKPLEAEEDDFFDCMKLCKKGRTCVCSGYEHLEEIKVLNCYVSKYPYEWNTPDGRTVRVCKFMFFSRNFPHDEENPYPTCLNPKPLVHIPKDRIVRDPQVCWTCYKLQKKAREEKLLRKAMRDEYAGQPRVNWYP